MHTFEIKANKCRDILPFEGKTINSKLRPITNKQRA
jgi:hypothetical protein